jgi:hypothetical protein
MDWTQPSHAGWANVPTCRKQGWTQPSRAGWADVPAQSKKGLDSAQPCGLG